MTSKEVADEYSSSLSDLTLNSKPLITMLTMLAEENLSHASVIVKVIEKQIHTCSNKLPLMYLIDSILKNVGKDYIKLFSQNIINTFTFVFEKVDERTRKKLYELRHTWNEVFANSKLFMLDTKVHSVDPAWPVAAGPSGKPATSKPSNIHINPNNIHINPNMIKPGVVKGASSLPSTGEKDLKDLEILKREEQILELKKQRLLLEQKKKDIEQSRHQPKAEAETAAKPEPAKPVSKPSEDPSINAEKRAEFLRSYKIKKKAPVQVKEDKKVSSTIHVDPRRVHQVLPQVAASVPVTSRDPRNEGSRDPRIKPEKSRDPRIPPEGPRDPRVKVDGPSRDPRLGASDPAPASVTSTPKTSEQQVTSSRDPRVSSKATENKPEITKNKKESPSKRKKSQKSETRSSKPPVKVKEAPPKPAKPAKTVESTPFKNRTSKVSRTYKQRDESPEEKSSSQSSSGKRSRGDRTSGSEDSDDSDHYVGNVPNQSLYRPSSKKPKKQDISSPPVISDTDYRHFTPPKRPSATNENASPPKKDKIMEEDAIEPPQGLGLFSNKDVDYRQILPRPMTVLPTAPIPPTVPPVFSTKDQDDRNPSSRDVPSRDPLACLNPPDNQDPAIPHNKGDMAPPDLLITPARSSEYRMRKSSFNSPHAASWEKFREKNPEFKEYTRQASISESEKSFSLENDDIEINSDQQHGFPVRIRDMSVPGKHDKKRITEGRRRLYDEEEEGSESPRRAETAQENYKVILHQAEDQMHRGEINITQYNQLLATVVTLMEQDKIQQVRDRDRHLRTPQPQGSDDGTGSDYSKDPHGPPALPPGGPGRPSPLSGTGSNIGLPGNHAVGHPGGPKAGPHGVSGTPDTVSSGGHPGAPLGGHSGGPPNVHSVAPIPRPHSGPPIGPHGGPTPGHRSGPGGPGSPGGPGRGHFNGDVGGRGGRGGGMRGEMMGGRGGMIGRGGGSGRGGLGFENEDGWGRGGRGRGRRGRGGFMKENRGWGQREVIEDEWTEEPELPFMSDEYLQTVDRENVTRKIEIDGTKREVRTYGQTAVVLMAWDDPRILTFGEGQCNIVFDGGIFRLSMRIGEDYKEFTFEGQTHRVRLGPPSEELILDGVGYHCLIGGDPITVQFDGAPHTIALDGKPPNVNIGHVRNTEFCAGSIQLVIQATKFVTLFLDARPQRFSIDGRAFIIKFVDSLKAVTINNQRFPVKFGGLPISICVRGYRRFLSFSNLPNSIIPGQIAIRGMEGESPSLPRSTEKKVDTPVMQPPKQITPPFVKPSSVATDKVPGGLRLMPPVQGPQGPMPQLPGPQGPPLQRPGLHGPPQPPALKEQTLQGPPSQSSVFPPSLPIPAVPSHLPGPRPSVPQQPPPAPSAQGLPQITPTPHETQPQGSQPQSAALALKSALPPQGHLPPPPTVMQGTIFNLINQPPPPIGINVPPFTPGSYTTTQVPFSVTKPAKVTSMPLDSLLANLTRIGLIGNKVRNKEEEKKEEEEEEEKEREMDERIPVELMLRSENLRKRRKWLIESVYRGMQCSSCGLRYPPEQTVQYSHHLDWHFRKNKKQQESTKKANTRKFYFSIDDWLQYEEIEDLEERVPSMFETEGVEEPMDAEETEVPSVAVSSDTSLEVCPTCHDKFTQFFHQETEEWRYRNAMPVDGLNYHPSCHQDNLREAEEAAKEAAEKEAAEKEAAEKEADMKEADKKDVDKKEADKNEADKKEASETEDQEQDADTDEAEMQDVDKVTADEKKTDAEKEGDEMETEDTQTMEEEANQDTVMESQASVTTKLDGLSLASHLSVRIKEEPMDVVDVDTNSIPPDDSLPLGITIKQEIKREPEEHSEEDLTSKIPEEEDETSLLNSEINEHDDHVWTTPTVAVNAAETDIASSIDGNTELSIADTNKTTAPKIVFNVSKPSVNNNNDIDNGDTNNDLNSTAAHDEEDEEFVPPPFTVDYDLKPAFRGVELIDQPMEARGIELSGLCSIM